MSGVVARERCFERGVSGVPAGFPTVLTFTQNHSLIGLNLLKIWLTQTTAADQLTSQASNLTLMKIFFLFFDFTRPNPHGEQHGSSSHGKLYSIHCCHGNICLSWAVSSQNARIFARNSFTSWFFWASNSCRPERSWWKQKEIQASYSEIY